MKMKKKKPSSNLTKLPDGHTGATGFEPAISALTGLHVRPLHHAPSIDSNYNTAIRVCQIILPHSRSRGCPLNFLLQSRLKFLARHLDHLCAEHFTEARSDALPHRARVNRTIQHAPH